MSPAWGLLLVVQKLPCVVFDYKKIADFYAAADENIQELMEKSALVIIDYDDAIKNGFVRHSEKLEAIAKGIFDAKRDE